MKVKLLNEEGVVDTVDYDAPIVESSYCQVNPAINLYARKDAEHFITILIFILASIRVRWTILMNLFPKLMQAFIEKGTCSYEKEKKPEWAILAMGVGKYMNELWVNRQAIFSIFKPLLESYANAKTEDEKFAISVKIYEQALRLKGFGLPKAGFIVQLVVGRLGCIDSNNLQILDVGSELLSKDGKTFKPVGINKKGEFTAQGKMLVEKYISVLKTFQKEADSNESQRLWDKWCELISKKIIHASNPKEKNKINVTLGGKSVEMNPYSRGDVDNNNTDVKSYDQYGVQVGKDHNPENWNLKFKEAVRNLKNKKIVETTKTPWQSISKWDSEEELTKEIDSIMSSFLHLAGYTSGHENEKKLKGISADILKKMKQFKKLIYEKRIDELRNVVEERRQKVSKYNSFKQAVLAWYGVRNVEQLSPKRKKEFYRYIDSQWKKFKGTLNKGQR